MKHKVITEPARKIEVIDEFDVVVVGCGIAGVSAALSAARNGAKVCVLERETCPGGLATLGLIVDYLPLCDGRGHQVSGGIAEELLKNTMKYGPADYPSCWLPGGDKSQRKKRRYELTYNAASFMISMEELMLDSGVKLFYDCRFCNIVKEGGKGNGKISAVIMENKEGRNALLCSTVIDASGDADVCTRAGEDTEVNNRNVCSWWFYSYNGIDLKLHRLTENFYDIKPGMKCYSGVTIEGISAMSADGRKRIAEFVNSHNDRTNADKIDVGRYCLNHDGTPMTGKTFDDDPRDIYPAIIPAYPGFRMTRRLKSGFELDASHNNQYFPDSIGMVGNWQKPGPIYYIPFSCLKGVKNSNLLTAGRCISTTDSGWDITRVIPACAVSGEAAGAAAAMAAKLHGGNIHELDLAKLQSLLKAGGVIIDKRFSRKNT